MRESISASVAERVLQKARTRGVDLWVEGRRLRFRAEAGVLDTQLRDELRQERDAVISLLREKASRLVVEGPVAENQQGIWLLHQMDPGSSAYNLGITVRIHGELDAALLEESLQVLVDRHAALRTGYPIDSPAPARLEYGSTVIGLAVIDASTMTAEELRDAVQHDFAASYEGLAAPLLRARLYRESSTSHVFLLGVHHIAADGASLFMLLEELAAIYSAFVAGEPLPSRAGAAEFSEFIEWQREFLDSPEAAASYWKATLAPPPPRLDLEVLSRRSDDHRAGGAVWIAYGSAVRERLNATAEAVSATPNAVMLAAWFAFLSRISGQDDIAIGIPAQGRPAARFSRTVGDFVNTLPIRARGLKDLTFSELVGQVNRSVVTALGHQDYPYPRMIRDAGPGDRDGGGLVSAFFAYQDFERFDAASRLMLASDEVVSLGRMRLSAYPIEQQDAQFPIALEVWPVQGGMRCALRYDGKLFDRGTAEHLLSVFATLLTDALERPATPVAELSIVPTADALQLNRWNRTARDYPADLTLVDLVEAQAARTADAEAVRATDGSYSYAALVERSRRIAAGLRSLGVQRGSRVGMMVDRGRDLIPALLGVLGSGASYVPLDRSFPVARLEYMLEDSGCEVLVTSRAVDAALVGTRSVIDLSEATLPEAEPFTPAGGEDEAYVIYTSGSTGKPKGVAVPHGALVNFLSSMAQEPGLGAGDTLLAVTTISFDIAALELYLPMTVGARVVVAGEDDVLDGKRLAEVMESEGVTVLQATPATWKLLLESGWSGKADLRAYCGGEALPEGLAEQLLGRVGELWNLYGPTETTIWSTVERVESAREITVGRAIGNTTLYVLDERMQRLPVGVPGELWIGGSGVALGYVNRPELTAERFVASPFAEGERIYRTGDLVRFRSDGKLQHLGRLDHQVKVRGYRIELGEIESRLQAHAEVKDAVVVAREERLIGYVVPAGAEVAADELRRWVGETLPDYMVPSLFMTLDALPLTPNGKVDRKALPEPAHAASTSGSGVQTPPRSPSEVALAEIWSEVLGIPTPALEQSFFELGGHSLLAARVANLVRDRVGVELTLRELFENPILGEQAAILENRDGARSAETTPILEGFEF